MSFVNEVHQLIKVRQNIYQTYSRIDKLLVSVAKDVVESLLSAPAIVFEHLDLGERDAMDIVTNDGRFALPFEQGVYVTRTGSASTITVVNRASSERDDCTDIVLYALFKRQNGTWYVGPTGTITLSGGSFLTRIFGEADDDGRNWAFETVVRRILLANEPGNQQLLIPNTLYKGRTLSAKDAPSVTKAHWEYREVELSSLPGYIYIPKGGTHASPRWHMRRGHWRNYKSGKRVWVEQMEVGDKSKGVIVKDYVVTNHLGVSK